MENFNKLTPAQTERLAKLAEECGEVVHVIGKILRHGYDSSNPDDGTYKDNRDQLEAELGDLSAAIRWMIEAGDFSCSSYAEYYNWAVERGMAYAHHQDADHGKDHAPSS